jgi:DNA-binding CsgD family transcriptional regulator
MNPGMWRFLNRVCKGTQLVTSDCAFPFDDRHELAKLMKVSEANTNSFLDVIRELLARQSRNSEVRPKCRACYMLLMTLSPRETEILQHMLDNRSLGQIAERQGTTASTVKTQRAHLYRKLNVTSVADLLIIVLLAEAYERSLREDGHQRSFEFVG